MKKSILLFNILLFVLSLNIHGQKPVIEFTFTGVNQDQWIPIENIVIKNITRGVDTTINYPDTTLVLHYQVGINEFSNPSNGLKVYQNYPNPAKGTTSIKLYIPEKDIASIMIKDAMGRQIINSNQELDKGNHTFQFTPGQDKLYIFTVYWRESSYSIKILNQGFSNKGIGSLEYLGNNNFEAVQKSSNDILDFSFDSGDDLIFVANANDMASGIFDEPKTDKSYTFQFVSNIPCPGDSTILYEGQTYHTIQVFNQCWLKENLNVGSMIDGTEEMEDDDILEKYCYNDSESNCDEYGGLYQWSEMMQYEETAGGQGICPPDWHIPTDDEWIILAGSVDSQLSIGDPSWYNSGYNGFDAGLNLKSEDGWLLEGNGNDSFGFLAVPSGQRISNGYFDGLKYKASFWSSSEDYPGSSWFRTLSYQDDGIDRSPQTNNWGKSIRCLKN